MTLTDRDRKIIMLLVPLALVAAYWFLLLAPKRKESAAIQDKLTQAQTERDTAVSKLASLTSAKKSFASDYAAVIYLGKSVPTNLDMPSLLVQLDSAARGTGIHFASVKAGQRDAAAASTPPGGGTPGAPSSGSAGSSGSSGTSGSGGAGASNGASSTPTGGTGSPASSGKPAVSGPGQAAQTAGSAASTANNASATSVGGAGGAAGGGASAAPPGLDSVPLDFEFRGSFFDLADFFHRMKRFVRVANDKIVVHGRLMTINSFSFETAQSFPTIVTKVHATVYLAPKAQGVDAGATPQGPAGAAPAAAGGAPAASPSSPTPTAVIAR